MKLVLFLVLVSSSLFLLVNAEYRWDQDAQEWVLVEDESPDTDSYSDTGSGTHYDDEDSDYDDDDGGSGDVDPWDEGDDGIYDRDGNWNQKGTSVKQPPTNSLDNSESPRNPYDNNNNNSNNNNNYNNMYNNNYDNGQNPGSTNYQQPEVGGGDIAIVDGPAGTGGGGSNSDDNFYSKPADNGGSKANAAGGSGHLDTSTTFFAKSGTMAAVIMGAVVGLLCAILCVMFVVYRMRKKDEGSYALDEPKRSPTANSYSKPPNREFYA